MIDWVTIIVPCRHRREDVDAGVRLHVDHNGVVLSKWEQPLRLRGSWDASVGVQTHDPDYRHDPLEGSRRHDLKVEPIRTHLRIDGNPAKWFQGHNLWGTSDPILIHHFVHDVLSRLGLKPLRTTGWRLTRVDVTHSYRVGTNEDAESWIRAAERTAVMRYRGRGNIGKGCTLYFGKRSRRMTLKIYPKHREICHNALPDLPARDSLYEWAEGIIRIEVCYRGMELQRLKLDQLDDLETHVLEHLYLRAMKNLNLNLTQSIDDFTGLSKAALSTYVIWESGRDPATMLPRSTWYRHRRELLQRGVDISALRDGEPIPVLSQIVASPASPPHWASDHRWRLSA